MNPIATQLAGISLDSYIFNASGPRCTSIEELITLAQSESGAIMTKSCTLEPRVGNPKPRYRTLPLGSIQSMGLPNLGYKAYLDMLPILKHHKKPVCISVSGLSVPDNIEMIDAFMMSNTDLIEVNFSCPNIEGKPQLGYDFEQTKATLDAICNLGDVPIGLKLPAYFDASHFDTMADIIKQYPIRFITCINSIGNTLVIDPISQTPVIKPKNGLGGLCGSYIKPIGLANVYNFRQRLPEEIQIIGVGGIYSGLDAFEYALAGAAAVQVATYFQEQGASCFKRLNNELAEVLNSKNYASIQEAIGKLSPLK